MNTWERAVDYFIKGKNGIREMKHTHTSFIQIKKASRHRVWLKVVSFREQTLSVKCISEVQQLETRKDRESDTRQRIAILYTKKYDVYNEK